MIARFAIKGSGLVAVCACLFISCSSGPTQNAALRFDPPLDTTFRISLSEETETPQYKLIDSFHLEVQLQCIKKDDSMVILKIKLDSIYFNSYKFLTDRERADLFKQLIRMSATIRVTRRGDIHSAEIAGDPKWPDFIKRCFNDCLSENAIKDFFNPVFTIDPGRKVKEGDIWSNTIVLISKAPVKISTVYTLTGLHDDTTSLDISSVISARQGDGGKLYLQGNQIGKANISYSCGIPYTYEVNAETVYSTDHSDIKMKQHYLFKAEKLQ